MKRVSVYFGIEKDRDNQQIPPDVRANALTEIKRDAAQRFGGFTYFHGAGGWINPDGALVEEGSIRFDVYTDKPFSSVYDFATFGGVRLNQASVLVDYNGHVRFLDILPLPSDAIGVTPEPSLA